MIAVIGVGAAAIVAAPFVAAYRIRRAALLAAFGFGMMFAGAAFAADPPKPPADYDLKLSPQQLQAVLIGLQELPFKVSAPVLQAITMQVQAADKKPAAAAVPAPPATVLKGASVPTKKKP